MKPTHYLNLGAGLVFLILAMIVGMNWLAGSRAAGQYLSYRDSQFELQELDHMRNAVHRIVSSTNEMALIATTAGHGNADSADQTAGKSASLQREQDLIASATEEFHASRERITSHLPSAAARLADATAAYDGLIAVNAELLTEISRDSWSADAIFELKEKQEAAEMDVLGNISSERNTVIDQAQASAKSVADSFSGMSKFAIIGGLLAALILLASNLYITRRVGGMFDEINAHQRHVEKANGDLNEALATLRKVQDDLVAKEKFATLGRLTATVSHELRNPLAAIRNSSFIIRQSISSAPEISDFVTRIDRNVTRCDHIISDLLEYTKTRALNLTRIDMGPWLEASLRDQMNLPGIALTIDAAEHGLFADIDEQRFVRAIINLVENAGQAIAGAMNNGKSCIIGGKITVGCARQGDRLRLTVTDNGPGIPETILKRIFEPLFTTKNFGAGLGLAITSNLVAEHGGTIEVASQPGHGTTFTILLPVANAQASEVAA